MTIYLPACPPIVPACYIYIQQNKNNLYEQIGNLNSMDLRMYVVNSTPEAIKKQTFPSKLHYPLKK